MSSEGSSPHAVLSQPSDTARASAASATEGSAVPTEAPLTVLAPASNKPRRSSRLSAPKSNLPPQGLSPEAGEDRARVRKVHRRLRASGHIRMISPPARDDTGRVIGIGVVCRHCGKSVFLAGGCAQLCDLLDAHVRRCTEEEADKENRA
ncbi:hypothetical protein AURDEDRAFT_174942 [Auricularia subglabra TFB-10046 SS5]|uniref:Uncharacterized protein n=1 Tax=Auricularia subglabra (strain TFB-10046 / SS5) TaxID=717982 RepID=J0WTW4_AURST|nr:hypothetical protein AURDEDRAFT_174942 [Auricularia subglabra TFB-10046 SS5]